MKRVGRRRFLQGSLLVGAGTLLGGCQATPTATPSPTATATPLPTPTLTPTPAIVQRAGVTISSEYLATLFSDPSTEAQLAAYGIDEAALSSAWHTAQDEAIAEDAVASIKSLVLLGDYMDQEGVFPLATQGDLANLFIARLLLKEIPEMTAKQGEAFPENLSLPQGTTMTVVGKIENDSIYAFFSDPSLVSQAGLVYLIGAEIPLNAEGEDQLSFAGLIAANGYEYDQEANQLTVPSGENSEDKTLWTLNKIEGEDLIANINQDTGLYYVPGYPTVPYPDKELPEDYQIKVIDVVENDDIIVSIKATTEDGESYVFRQACSGEDGWSWAVGWSVVSHPLEVGTEEGQVQLAEPLSEEKTLAIEKKFIEAGEVGIFFPQGILESGGEIRFNSNYRSDAAELFIILADGKSFAAPSMMSGEVTLAQQSNLNRKSIWIIDGRGLEMDITVPENAQLLVEKGDKVVLGQALFTIDSDWGNSLQEGFRTDSGLSNIPPEGTIGYIYLWDSEASSSAVPAGAGEKIFYHNEKGEILQTP